MKNRAFVAASFLLSICIFSLAQDRSKSPAASGVDVVAAQYGVDPSGNSDSTQSLIKAIHATSTDPKAASGGVVDVGAGTISICNLSIDRAVRLYGHGGAYTSSATVFQVQPGCMGLIVDQGNTSADGGSASFSDLGYFEVQGTTAVGTVKEGSDTISGIDPKQLASLRLLPGDYLTVMGRVRDLWGDIFPYATTKVRSIGASSVTVEADRGAAFSSAERGAFVMKAGLPVSRGTSISGSKTLGVSTGCKTWHPGDPIMGPGIHPEMTAGGAVLEPDFVTGVHCEGESGTLTLIQAAADRAGEGVFYRGPAPGILVRTQVYLHNITIRFAPGNGLDTNSNAAGYQPKTGADGSEYERIFSFQTGGSCIHDQGGDSNVLTYINGYSHYCAQGGHVSDSFLGTVVMNEEVANVTGPSYATTNPNAAHVFINAYAEGDASANVWSQQTLVLGGVNPGNTSGVKNGNVVRSSGQISPSFFSVNNQSGSTATLNIGSNVLENVTKIAQWHRGDILLCDLCPTSGLGQRFTYVLDSDGTGKLTINGRIANASAENEPITPAHTEFNIGSRSAGLNSLFGLYSGESNAHVSGYEFQLDDPSYLSSPAYQPGWFSLRYRNTESVMSLSTDLSGGVDVPPGDAASRVLVKFPQGLQLGSGANSVCVTSSASGGVPVTGWFTPGCIVLSPAGGIWQQTTQSKNFVRGHADTSDGTSLRVPISSIDRSGKLVTIHTKGPHSFKTGMYLLVVGVTASDRADFDGIFGPVKVTSEATLEYEQAVPASFPNSSGTGGSVALSPYVLNHLDEEAESGCASGDTVLDSVNPTAIKPGTTILTIGDGFALLSRNTTEGHPGDSIACKRQPRAHPQTNCMAQAGSDQLTECNLITSWAGGDTVIGEGIPSGSFVKGSPAGHTIAISQKATRSGRVEVTDAEFVAVGSNSSVQVRTMGTPIAAGACQAQTSVKMPSGNRRSTFSWTGSGAMPASWAAGITVQLWASGNSVTPYLCNSTSKEVTPAAVTLNIQ